MGITGLYKVSKLMVFSEDGFKMGTVDEYAEAARKHFMKGEEEHEEAQLQMMIGAIVDVNEDGMIYDYVPIPAGASKEEIEKAVESGEVSLAPIDGYMSVSEAKPWKEEDGVYKYDTRQHRELMGEILSSWDDMKFDGKTITLADGLSVYEKIED